jgi:hypothetical protein
LPSAEKLQEAWAARLRTAPIEPVIALTGAGLVLGAGTVLAGHSANLWGPPAIDISGNEERILALLAVACGRAIGPNVIDNIRRASEHAARGEVLSRRSISPGRACPCWLTKRRGTSAVYRRCLARRWAHPARSAESLRY